jgi:chromosome segregation ATPase
MSIRVSRWFVAALGALLVSSVGAGTLWSYFRTMHAEIGRQVRDAIPIGFELKRLEQMTADLIPEIQANQKVAAQLEVEIEYLDREIAELDDGQQRAKAEMDQLRDGLRTKKDEFVFGGQSFTRRQVEEDLERRLARYDDRRIQLDAKQRILDSRRKTLQAATDKIQACRYQHDLLVDKTQSLQAELKLVELAQASGNFQFDHSKLQRSKDLALELEKRIRTLNKLVEGQQPLADEIPVAADTRSASDKFDAYFTAADEGAK